MIKQKSVRYKILTSLIGFYLAFSPSLVSAQTQVSEDQYREVLLNIISLLQQQITQLQAQLELQPVIVPATENPDSIQSIVKVLEKYDITSSNNISQINNPKHQAYFSRVVELFPGRYADMIGAFIVFDGGEYNIDAFVETIPPLHEEWVYGVHEDMLARPNSKANTELIVHELAHLVSYEEIIGVPRPGDDTCVVYFERHGCPARNSFLSEFTNQFWGEEDLDRAASYSSLETDFDILSSFYDVNKSAYVSDYAVSRPEEDFAESFMFYVLMNNVELGVTAQKKVSFFSKFDSLATLRSEIREVR